MVTVCVLCSTLLYKRYSSQLRSSPWPSIIKTFDILGIAHLERMIWGAIMLSESDMPPLIFISIYIQSSNHYGLAIVSVAWGGLPMIRPLCHLPSLFQ